MQKNFEEREKLKTYDTATFILTETDLFYDDITSVGTGNFVNRQGLLLQTEPRTLRQVRTDVAGFKIPKLDFIKVIHMI